MEIDILTLFPEMFSPLEASIVGRARAKGLVQIRIWNIRDFTADRHRTADDAPYGGGGGMVMKPEPVFECFDAAEAASPTPVDDVVLLAPQGRRFDQRIAKEMASLRRIALICGHYEGVDERIRAHLATSELSIGDYVLTGGELPAMVVVDAVVRLLPGVLGNEKGAEEDSFASGLLEHPHYTRPPVYRGYAVPEVLLSGDHERIRRWRRTQALKLTRERRPDLLAAAELTPEDRKILAELAAQDDEEE